jgi:hypothetical protein
MKKTKNGQGNRETIGNRGRGKEMTKERKGRGRKDNTPPAYDTILRLEAHIQNIVLFRPSAQGPGPLALNACQAAFASGKISTAITPSICLSCSRSIPICCAVFFTVLRPGRTAFYGTPAKFA